MWMPTSASRRRKDGGAFRRWIERFPIILQFDETFDVGADTETGVDDKDYKVPFEFTGKLDKLTIAIDRSTLTPEESADVDAGG
jgi:hypothetical protein